MCIYLPSNGQSANLYTTSNSPSVKLLAPKPTRPIRPDICTCTNPNSHSLRPSTRPTQERRHPHFFSRVVPRALSRAPPPSSSLSAAPILLATRRPVPLPTGPPPHPNSSLARRPHPPHCTPDPWRRHLLRPRVDLPRRHRILRPNLGPALLVPDLGTSAANPQPRHRPCSSQT